MNARQVIALLLGGFALVGFAVWVSSQRHLEHASAAGDLVLPGLEAALNSVTRLELARGDGAHTALARGTQGWSVEERGWPADSGRVRKLLLDLGALNVVEEKTREPANYPALGVENVDGPKATGTRIAVHAPPKGFVLIVGKSSSAKSGYVRVPGAPQSYLAAPLLSVDADPRRWLDRNLLDVVQDRVQGFEITPATGPAWSAARERKEQQDFAPGPLPRGRSLASPGAANPVAGALAGLQLDDVQKRPADAAAGKTSRARFRTFDGLVIDVTGHKDDSHAWIAVAASGTANDAAALQGRLAGWEFEIPSWRYDQIFRPLEELLQKPAEKPAGGQGAKGKTRARAGASPGSAPLPTLPPGG